MTLLQVEGLSRSFGARRVLRDVSFSLAAGEVVGLVGANGAGKSTLGDIVAGITAPDSGTMTLQGRAYAPLSAEDARHLGVGVVEQLIRIDPELTVAQAVFRGTARAGRPQAELRRQAQVLLSEVTLDIDPDTVVGELPHFVYGLVEIARMLAEDTRLVVLDEVSAALLPAEVTGLHAVADRLRRQGRGVLYISHRLPEMLQVVDRVLVLREGRIALDAPSSSLDPVRLAAATIEGTTPVPLPRTAPQPASPAAPQAAVPARPDPAEGEVVLQIRNLRVPGHVDGVDLDLRRGEIIGLTGHRSSGVREIAEALSGELPAITDEVVLHGEHRSTGRAEEAPDPAAARLQPRRRRLRGRPGRDDRPHAHRRALGRADRPAHRDRPAARRHQDGAQPGREDAQHPHRVRRAVRGRPAQARARPLDGLGGGRRGGARAHPRAGRPSPGSRSASCWRRRPRTAPRSSWSPWTPTSSPSAATGSASCPVAG